MTVQNMVPVPPNKRELPLPVVVGKEEMLKIFMFFQKWRSGI
jgi:hypothetical protein